MTRSQLVNMFIIVVTGSVSENIFLFDLIACHQFEYLRFYLNLQLIRSKRRVVLNVNMGPIEFFFWV